MAEGGAQAECTACGSEGGLRILWDGRAYCEACIHAASPKLLEMARLGGRLTGRPGASWLAVFGMQYLVHATASTVFCAIAILASILASVPNWAAAVSGLFLLWNLVAVFKSFFAALAYALANGYVEAVDGKLLISVRSVEESVPIRACSWSTGRLAENNMFGGTLLPLTSATVLRVPRSHGEETLISIGSKTERQLWESFLVLAKVRKHSTSLAFREFVESLHRLLRLTILVVVVGVVCVAASKSIQVFVGLCGGARFADISDTISVVVGILLFFTILVLSSTPGPSAALEGVESTCTVGERRRTNRGMFVIGTFLSLFSATVLCILELTIRARLVGLFLSVVWVFWLVHHIARRHMNG